MRNLWTIAKEDFINLIRNPMWVFFATGFPILLVLILGYLTRNSYGGSITSYDYYGITLMIYAIVNSGMTSANAFMEERIRKPNMRIIYAPGSVSFIFLSKIIASFAFSFLFHMIDLALLCGIFHISIGSGGYVIVLFALTELFSVVLGIMICCIVKTESMANQIQSIIVNILVILGGVLFSLDGYGESVRMVSLCSPIKWVVKTVFQIIYDKDMHLFIPSAGIMSAGIVLMLVLCFKTFHAEDTIKE